MTALRDAQDAGAVLVSALERAKWEAPCEIRDSVKFARAEARVLVKRIANLRRIVGDVDDPAEDPGAA